MTRHSKNATAGPTYTYAEKNKDSKQSGYGSTDVRLGKDAIKEFDCCSLSLQPCRNPVITPEGWIYEKEAILEFILHKKVENQKMLKQFEKQKDKKDKDIKELALIQHKEKLEKFLKSEGKIVSASLGSAASSLAASSKKSTDEDNKASAIVSNMTGKLSKELPSFWIPSLVPESKTTAPMKKPNTQICCPMSGKPLSMRDLVDVKFKLLDDKDNNAKSLIARKERYVCAVTNDVLGNSVQCYVLKTSGSVVTAECVNKLIRKEMLDPTNGKKMVDSDIIPIQRGGSGFSGSGVSLVSKVVGPAMIS